MLKASHRWFHRNPKEFYGPLGQGGATGKFDMSEFKGPAPRPGGIFFPFLNSHDFCSPMIVG